MIRHLLAALAASLIVGACSDSIGPHVTPPAAGVYVLRTINGASLPNDAVYPSYVTVAETLFVATDHSYFVAGTYYARYAPSFHQVSPHHTFQISGDSLIAPALGQGANGSGSFGAAALTIQGDTLVAAYFSGGITRYVRAPTTPGSVASLMLTTPGTLLVQSFRPAVLADTP